MEIFQNTKIFYHFHVYYREAWNGNANYRDSLFVICKCRELYEGSSKRGGVHNREEGEMAQKSREEGGINWLKKLGGGRFTLLYLPPPLKGVMLVSSFLSTLA